MDENTLDEVCMYLVAAITDTNPDKLQEISDILTDILPVVDISHILNEYLNVENVIHIPEIPLIFYCSRLKFLFKMN